jgi:hypothetical protein
MEGKANLRLPSPANVVKWRIVFGKRRGRRKMHPNLEVDFRNQQTSLLRLIAERLDLQDGTTAAEEVDQQIAQAKDRVHSYQAIKWSELQGSRGLCRIGKDIWNASYGSGHR